MSAKPYTDAPDAVTLHRDPGGYWHRWGDPGAPINGPEVKYVRADLWEAAVQDLAARDAELARLRAAVPADVAGLAKELRAYGFGGALSVAADALESQARALEMARSAVAGTEQRMHEIEIAARKRLDDMARELAANGERIAKLTKDVEEQEAILVCASINIGCVIDKHADALRLEVARRAALVRAVEVYLDATDGYAQTPERQTVDAAIESPDPAARAMLDKIAKLEAVAKYTQHKASCSFRVFVEENDGGDPPCDCGVQEAFDAIAQLVDGTSGKVKP